MALGLLAATGFQPLGLWIVTLLSLAGLIGLIARAPSWPQAAVLGWCFGGGYFALGLNWIATAFTYQANMPAWLGWIAVILIALFLALFPALAVLGAWFTRRSLAALTLALATTWIVTEWLRSWLFTGFAWNPLSAVLLGEYNAPGLARLLPFAGTYALSGLVVLIGGGFACLACQRARRDRGRRGALRFAWLATVMALYAVMNWPTTPGHENRTAVRYTLVQPDIRQEILNDPATFEDQFAKIAALSQDRHPGTPRLVLWPESGVPDYLRSGYPQQFYNWTYGADPALSRARIGRVIGPDSLLLTGTSDLELGASEAVGARNVVTVLDGAGVIRGSYAKAHLVPGGEYLPLRWLLEPIGAARLVPGDIDYWPGPGPRTLDLQAFGKVGAQICYEIIFSGQVTDRTNRPDFLFNPSNDGWFGAWGPPQHLAQARMRAIEEGLPVLRATTTGISAVIDAQGVVRQSVPHHVAGRLDGSMPEAAAPTLFSRLGNVLALGWALVFLGLSLVALRRRAE